MCLGPPFEVQNWVWHLTPVWGFFSSLKFPNSVSKVCQSYCGVLMSYSCCTRSLGSFSKYLPWAALLKDSLGDQKRDHSISRWLIDSASPPWKNLCCLYLVLVNWLVGDKYANECKSLSQWWREGLFTEVEDILKGLFGYSPTVQLQQIGLTRKIMPLLKYASSLISRACETVPRHDKWEWRLKMELWNYGC